MIYEDEKVLRQVYIYLKQELIYQYFFAKGLDDAQISMLFNDVLKSFFLAPIEGKAFSKPQFDMQIHYEMYKGVFFLFVTDMADRPQTIQKEIERAAKLFSKNFPDPSAIKTESADREEFQNFIQETHYYLHPKIALIGGKGAGKSTLAKIFAQTEEPEKQIMNFAVYYRIKIKDLDFDLWDYIDSDDYSMLWNNYIRGTDMLFFLINGAELNEKREINFYNLYKRESKYSKLAIILTHADETGFIGEYDFKEKFANIGKYPILEINLNDPNAKAQLTDFFIDTIGLKKGLPPEFRDMVVNANQLVEKEEYKEAIEKLQDLLILCRKYQDFTYVELFEGKIKEMEEKLKAKLIREEQDKIKISKPKEIQFGKFSGPKTLPIPGSLPEVKLSESKPSVASLPKIEPKLPSQTAPSQEPKSENKEQQSQIPPTTPSLEDDLSKEQAEILSSVKAKNPFFGGLKPLTQSPSKPQLLTPLDIGEDTSLQNKTSSENIPKAELENISTPTSPNHPPLPKLPPTKEEIIFRTNEAVQKVKPINIAELEGKTETKRPSHAEQIMQKSFGMTSGTNTEKVSGIERSPLVKNEIIAPKSDIVKTRPLQVPQLNIDITKAFSKQKTKEQIDLAQEADNLGEAIRNLGESLSRPMCEKFIEQMRLRLKKTNLTSADIEMAAKLYVDQRRKQKTD